MSRIGKVPVEIPSGVEVNITNQSVHVKGPKGDLNKDFSSLVVITKEDNLVVVKPADNSRTARADCMVLQDL